MVTPRRAQGPKAAATQTAILEAARKRFARDGYGVGLRGLAGDAGVDPALVCRYFGSKEGLFRAVLASGGPPTALLDLDLAEFGDRVAQMLIVEPVDQAQFDKLLICLRSISSPDTSDAIREDLMETFYRPLEVKLGCAVRARLVAGIIMGFALARAVDETYALEEGDRAHLRRSLAAVLQQAVERP